MRVISPPAPVLRARRRIRSIRAHVQAPNNKLDSNSNLPSPSCQQPHSPSPAIRNRERAARRGSLAVARIKNHHPLNILQLKSPTYHPSPTPINPITPTLFAPRVPTWGPPHKSKESAPSSKSNQLHSLPRKITLPFPIFLHFTSALPFLPILTPRALAWGAPRNPKSPREPEDDNISQPHS